METLLFGNYVFNDGLNVTCRSGLKWAQKVHVGDWVILGSPTGPDGDCRRCERNFDHVAEIVEVHVYARAKDALLSPLLQYEHDPACRTRLGLWEEMARIYGDDFVDDPLVVLVFKLKGKLIDPVA